MALKKGLPEGGQEEDVASRVSQCEIGLDCRHIACVKKVVDGRRGFRWNNGSFGRACCKDYLLACWWEDFSTVLFSVCVAMYYNGRTEGFYVLQMRRNFTEDSSESGVILWCGLLDGLLAQVVSLTLLEPSCCA